MSEEKFKYAHMINEGNINGFLDIIDQMAASKAYIVIRDEITNQHIKAIKESGKDNYQKFQDIKQRAKQSWDYDHRQALIEDVNRGCVNVYTLILKIMRAHNDDFTEELSKLQKAINRIEEKVGLEPTVWQLEIAEEISTDGGNNDAGDVQGVQENI